MALTPSHKPTREWLLLQSYSSFTRTKGRDGVVSGHSFAVVHDPDQPLASGFDLDVDLSGAGVQSVFEQLFHDGRRPLDYLTGGGGA